MYFYPTQIQLQWVLMMSILYQTSVLIGLIPKSTKSHSAITTPMCLTLSNTIARKVNFLPLLITIAVQTQPLLLNLLRPQAHRWCDVTTTLKQDSVDVRANQQCCQIPIGPFAMSTPCHVICTVNRPQISLPCRWSGSKVLHGRCMSR